MTGKGGAGNGPKDACYQRVYMLDRLTITLSVTDSLIMSMLLITVSWWHYQMETFSASLAHFAGNSSVTGEFPLKRPVTRSFDVFFDLRLNKRLSKQSICRWFETPSRSSRRHCNVVIITMSITDSLIMNRLLFTVLVNDSLNISNQQA